jgi:sugar transferase (PEP-CTERM/EpsH1 system associated)
MESKQPPLIVHIIFQLAIGGLENGLINIINKMPAERYRHAIISLTNATNFRERIQRSDVEIYELHKQEGQDWKIYFQLWKLLRYLQPALVHSRNLAALEGQLPAFLAGVKVRVHGEHGWDITDLGKKTRYRYLRRFFRPLISCYIPLSKELENYLLLQVGVSESRIYRICNGVDTEYFHPPNNYQRALLPHFKFANSEYFIIGTIGRMQPIKNQLVLIKAFIRLLKNFPSKRDQLRLVIAGDGPVRTKAIDLLTANGIRELAWLPGYREDIPELLRSFDIFVLPSYSEGISNTILEAMASGLPVVATNVGGNAELVQNETTGFLVPVNNPEKIADALGKYIKNPLLKKQHSIAARKLAENRFSINFMVQQYIKLYDSLVFKP